MLSCLIFKNCVHDKQEKDAMAWGIGEKNSKEKKYNNKSNQSNISDTFVSCSTDVKNLSGTRHVYFSFLNTRDNFTFCILAMRVMSLSLTA